MLKRAVVATDGLLKEDYAKTAHGLIRGSERFDVMAIIDHQYIGRDAGEILDGKHRNIPVFAGVDEAISQFSELDCLIIGVATVGGVLSDSLLVIVKESIKRQLSVVNGLHDQLTEREDIVLLAKEHNVTLTDIR
jgi:uncharacterized NAD-dependent epimerase/dehydratase family protein